MNQPIQINSTTSADGDQFCSLIKKVHHLIEVCLTHNVDQQHCAHLLHLHAGIQPEITITVWRELEKSNPGFFKHYYSKKLVQSTTTTTTTVLQDITNILHQT